MGLLILIDYRIGSAELEPLIKRIGVRCEKTELQSGDIMFEGRGPNGPVLVGIERKKLHDMLNCIDDARYNDQRIRMRQDYDISILMVEGHWKPHDNQGFLMEGFSGGIAWGYCQYRSQRTMYSKLKRYLMSVALSGVVIDHSRDAYQTAYNICEWYHYFQKRDHTSLLEIQKIAIPTMNYRPTLVRKWANDIEGIGTKLSLDAEKVFKKPITLANSDERDWLRIPGIGIKMAQQIIKDIWGTKR